MTLQSNVERLLRQTLRCKQTVLLLKGVEETKRFKNSQQMKPSHAATQQEGTFPLCQPS
jgi:hypothetical protein